MGDLQENLGVNFYDNYDFFVTNLKDEVEWKKRRVMGDELCYVAGNLASYAFTSSTDHVLAPPTTLGHVFRRHVTGDPSLNNLFELEKAAAETLLLAGFFRDQMARRIHVKYFEEVGQNFYLRASTLAPKPERGELLVRMAESFPFWMEACRDLSRTLRDNRFLLRLN